MFAADQRDDLAEPRRVQVDQRLAVAVFLLGHAVKHFCGIGKFGAQPFRVATVDPRVILFRGDGEREDFLFAQIVEAAALVQKTHSACPF